MPEASTPTSQDRLLQSIRSIIRAEFPQLTYIGLWEYAVVNSDGTTVDATPTDATIPLPQLSKIPLRAGIFGVNQKPSSETRLAVSFLNGDPTRPVVVGAFDSTGAKSVAFTTGSMSVNAGSLGTQEHVATVEAVINLFINFVYFLNTAGNPSSWSTTILNPVGFPATFLAALTTMITDAAAQTVPPTNATGGGELSAFGVGTLVKAALLLKLPDLIGDQPSLGAPNFTTG